MDWGDIKKHHNENKKKTIEIKDYDQKNQIHQNLDLNPKCEELENLELACQKLFELDIDALIPELDYKINLQSGKWSQDHTDHCQESLFSYINNDIFKHRPVYAKFFCILDNYIAQTGVQEVVTNQELQENKEFIEAIINTPVIKYLFNYLKHLRIVDDNIQNFKNLLYELWFELYSRECKNDSSGFEHVFLGEQKKNEVIGFHNWIQFLSQEQLGLVNYKGWLLNKNTQKHPPSNKDRVLNINFDWNNKEKICSSCFIGSSPAFEIALYTLCFYAGKEDNFIQFDKYSLNIKCYKFQNQHKLRIGSCFPILM